MEHLNRSRSGGVTRPKAEHGWKGRKAEAEGNVKKVEMDLHKYNNYNVCKHRLDDVFRYRQFDKDKGSTLMVKSEPPESTVAQTKD